MNIQDIKLSLLAIVLAMGTSLITSCADDLEVASQFNEDAYGNIYKNNAYLRDGKTNKVSNIIELHQDVYVAQVKMGLSKATSTATSAKVKVQ